MKRTSHILPLIVLALAGIIAGLCAPQVSAQALVSGQESVPRAERPQGRQGARPGGRRAPPPGSPREGIDRRRQERQQLMQFRILDRLSKMSPEERERLLSKLPPPRRRSVEMNLRRFQEMPPQRREALAARLRQFEQMSPERQERLRELIRSLGQLPRERRQLMQAEFGKIKRMSEEDRLDYTSSSSFQQKFSEDERDLLFELVETAPDP